MKGLFVALFILCLSNCKAQDTLKQNGVSHMVDSSGLPGDTVKVSYPGGQRGLTRYIVSSPIFFEAAEKVRRKHSSQTFVVKVEFNIDEEGNVSDIKALTNNGQGLEEATIKLIEKSGKWIPTQLNGKNIKSGHTQSVSFTIE